MRPAWLEIDLNAVTENARRVRAHVGPQTSLLAIVKANAYGHGIVPSAKAALRGGAVMLGVAMLDEAVTLREAGIDAPVLVLGAPLPELAEETVRVGASQVVSCREMIEAFSRAAQRQGRTAHLHLKVDTGMSRVGAAPEEAAELALFIDSLPGARLEGVCTHFATSDEDPEFMHRQNAVFQGVLGALEAVGVRPALRHAANSGATQTAPETWYDLVRPGLLLFGCPPLPDEEPSLLPVLKWKSRIAQVRTFPAGTGVGYGQTAHLRRESRLGVVPLGYADGYRRSLSNRGRVLVRGEWASVVGRVSMDQFNVDLTDIPGAQLGDEVVLVGRQGDRSQTVDNIAADADTNAHEILAGLSPRLPRIYRGE